LILIQPDGGAAVIPPGAVIAGLVAIVKAEPDPVVNRRSKLDLAPVKNC